MGRPRKSPDSSSQSASKPKAADTAAKPDATAALSKRLTALEDRIAASELVLGSNLGITVQ